MESPDVLESYFWQQVKSGLSGEEIHLERIENSTGSGVSDVSACSRGREIWLELKVAHRGWVSFRTAQDIFIRRRSAVGGIIFVLIRDEDTLKLYAPDSLLNAPRSVDPKGKRFRVKLANAVAPPIFQCTKPFRWTQVQECIFARS